ncbi:MAG TPA: hypothetical protein VE960_01690, partial [bacterium]|nr:hypothetical protein [bacterium]
RSDAVVILLTDGKLVPVYDDFARYQEVYEESRKRLLELASLCGEHGIRVCTIALGREEKVDGELMRTVADRTGGTYRHVASAPDVVEAYREIAVEQRSMMPAEPVEPAVVEEPTANDSGGGLPWWVRLSIQDVASASDVPEESSPAGTVAERKRAWTSSGITAFPSNFCLASGGLLGVLIGVVAVGSQKRQRWAAHFSTAAFGTKDRRVRGYLKPMDSPGMNSARPNIGLENPGVGTIKVGCGTGLLPRIQTTMKFTGTSDGTPPELHVLKGQVTVEGETVTSLRMKDGDILEFEGMRYQYLRGNRR